MSGMKVKELMDSLKGDFLWQTWAGLAAWGG